MLTRGRERGGKPGTGLSGRSVNLTLGRLKATFELAVLEGKLVRNLVALVDKVSYQQAERHTWTQAEVRKFLGVPPVGPAKPAGPTRSVDRGHVPNVSHRLPTLALLPPPACAASEPAPQSMLSLPLPVVMVSSPPPVVTVLLP